MCLDELMLIKPKSHAGVLFATVIRFQPMQKAMSFNKLAIVSFKGNYYRINFGTRVKMKP